MKKFELIEHTADAKFRAYGESMEEAFANAVIALTSIATTPERVRHDRAMEMQLNSETKEALLFDLIDQIIFLIDTEGFLPAEAESLGIIKTEDGFQLNARLVGDDVTMYGSNLKAATYSDMFVEEKDGKWTLQAVVDI